MEILRALEDCREEGRSINPEIILTSNLEACVAPIFPVETVVCGEILERTGRMRSALKRCLPLAIEPWVIVFEVTEKRLRYGLVCAGQRADARPFADELFDFLKDNNDLPVIHLCRLGSLAIFVRTTKRELVFSLTLSNELLCQPAHIDQFAKVVVGDIGIEQKFAGSAENLAGDAPTPEQKQEWQDAQERTQQQLAHRTKQQRESSLRVIRGLLEKACREGHGLLACVVAGKNLKQAKKKMKEGAYLAEPLDLRVAAEPGSGDQDIGLRARLDLSRRMVECDLVTIFSTQGQILGYNIHVPNTGGRSGVAGGACMRAFLVPPGSSC